MNFPTPSTKDAEFFRHRFNLLERTAASFSQDKVLTPLQREVDGLVGGFIRQASDGKALAAMTAGSVAFRLGRVGVMAMGRGCVGVLPLQTASFAVGLGAEVSAYEGMNRTLMSGSWRWSGSQGLKAGLTSSFITFLTLKAGGRFAQRENLILQHGIQDLAMVAGHELVYQAGIGPRPEESLAQRILHAEVTNLELGAGMALGHGLTAGRLQAMERDLNFNLPPFLLAGTRPILAAMAESPVRRYFSDSLLMSRYKPGANRSQKRPVQEGSPSQRKEKNRDKEWGKEYRLVAAEESKEGNRQQVLGVLKDLERELRIVFGHRILGRERMAEVEEMTRALKEQLVAGEEKFKVIFSRLLPQLESLEFLFRLDPLAKAEALEPYRPWIEFFFPRRNALFEILKEINVQLEGGDLNELGSLIYLLHQLNAYLEGGSLKGNWVL